MRNKINIPAPYTNDLRIRKMIHAHQCDRINSNTETNSSSSQIIHMYVEWGERSEIEKKNAGEKYGKWYEDAEKHRGS